ncbi:MAG: DegQ family serine endoprotease [Porticoccaceae bacterium]
MLRKLSLLWLLVLFQAGLAQADLPDFADLIEETSPAVVKINTVQKVAGGGRMMMPPGQQVPEIFRELFEQRGMPERNAYSMGSGFIISGDGYVLTNNHVVDGASEISVRLSDRREFSAEVVGTDPRSDLALLKIDAGGLPVVKLAAPDKLRVGEWVVAIGSPFGLDYSASVGIVSAIGRSLPTDKGENYVPFIQSDVAINPGNSGGPLFNLQGEVVGINSQIYTRTGGSIGLSFAIPVSVAIDVVDQLKEKGRVERGWLGVYIQEVDKNLASSLGLDKPQGALIAQVIADSPAEKSGLKPGDVIIRFNDRVIRESGDLPHQVGLLPPGGKADAELIREGKKRTLAITVGSLPEGENDQASTGAGGDVLGLSLQNLDQETSAALGIRGGVVIDNVAAGSPAQSAGLLPGDIIVQLGNARITSVKDYTLIRGKIPKGTPVLVRFLRQGQFIFRTIQIAP